MSKGLVIVESPAKVKTLEKFLGGDYVVKASVGHIKDLPEGELGVDLEKDFQPQYVTITGKAKVIRELKKASKGVKNIYLGPDPDREGEAIAWHIAEEIDEGKAEVYRVAFEKEKELTDRALKLAEVGKPKSNLQLQGILGLAVFALGFLMGK
jgi:DNA topoisomerase-1